jgi:hypothetical protein
MASRSDWQLYRGDADCIENEYGNPVCEVDDGSWEECELDGRSVQGQGQRALPVPVSTPLGGVCWTGPPMSPIGQNWNTCNAPLVCAAAPIGEDEVTALMASQLQRQDNGISRDSAPLNLANGTLGICVPKPQNMDWAPVLE